MALIYAHSKDDMETIDAATRKQIRLLIHEVHKYLALGGRAGKREKMQ